MKKPSDVVIRETIYVAGWVLVLSAFMQLVFFALGKWDIKVLLGNLTTGVFSVLNFFVMGIYVQKATEKDEKDAKTLIKASHSLRTVILFAVAGISVYFFNVFSSVIPLFFPRVAYSVRPLFNKKINQ